MKKLIGVLSLLIYTTYVQAQVYVVGHDAVCYYDKVIVEADANSFDVLYDNQLFSKDKNSIYYKGKKTNFDVHTFEIHNNSRYDVEYLSDKNNVYVSNDVGFVGIGSMSPGSFNFITKDIAIDDETIYWKFQPLIGSDASSIQLLTSEIFKDKYHVYQEQFRMPLNTDNLSVIKAKGYDSYLLEYIGDENMVCDDNNYCHNMDVHSFMYINFNYVKDNSQVLYRNSYIKADAKTFEVPTSDMEHYAKDQFHQFYLDNVFPVEVDEKHIKPDSLKAYKNRLIKQLEVAFSDNIIQQKYDMDDKATLSIIYRFPNSKNTIIEKGKNIYMNGERQAFIEAGSFEIFNNDYAKDKNQVYLIYEYADKVTFNPINGIDPNTFSIIENNYDSYCRDAKNVYHRASKVKDADLDTFTVMERYYAEDKNSIFLMTDGDRLHTIKPTKGVRLIYIEGRYFSFGDKILYIDNGRESFVENPVFGDFKVLNYNYARNGKQVIYKGRVIGVLEAGESIINIDGEEIVTSGNRKFQYGQDMTNVTKNKIYKLASTNYSTDGHTLYYDDVFEVKGVDLASIHHSSAYINYFTFKNNKALYENIVFDIDLETFEEFRGLYYARDKNYVYYKGKNTKLDPATFFLHGSDFTSDKNGVYYYNKLIPGADSKSFYVFEEYGFDDDYFYHANRKVLRSTVDLK